MVGTMVVIYAPIMYIWHRPIAALWVSTVIRIYSGNISVKAETESENYSLRQAKTLPSSSMCISPLGCLNPNRRPGRIGIGSRLLFILVKLAICESKKVAQAALPTRGVPNVTLRTVVPVGRLSFMKSVSSSASAPPNEWPI